MKEDLLHHIWKYQRFNHGTLLTADGGKLSVIHPGHHNHNSGPDFLNARIKMDQTLWLGHVEIHVTASEWKSHKHQTDPAYNNVILHVVYDHNYDAVTSQNTKITTLELKSRIEEAILTRYEQIFTKDLFIPCQKQLPSIPRDWFGLYLERLLIERLEKRNKALKEKLVALKGHWEALLFHALFRYFGFKTNNTAMETLAESIGYKIFLANSSSMHTMEALVFGQSGLITKAPDRHCERLMRDHRHLCKKYDLKPMTGQEWHFSRMRPQGFPCVRLAQLLGIYHKQARLFNHFLEDIELKRWHAILKADLPTYWESHNHPGRKCSSKNGGLGHQSRDMLIINVIIPVFFTYARTIGNNIAIDRLINLYHMIKAEKNKVIRHWHRLNIIPNSAGESQALLELKSSYCNNFRCMTCQVGTKLLLK